MTTKINKEIILWEAVHSQPGNKNLKIKINKNQIEDDRNSK